MLERKFASRRLLKCLRSENKFYICLLLAAEKYSCGKTLVKTDILNNNKNIQSVLGIDLGSRNVKICLMKDAQMEPATCIETMTFYRNYGRKSEEGFHVDLDALGCQAIDRIVSTGYGRMAASISGADNISELTAHFLGARYQTGLTDFTLLDLGGQDYKVMRVKNGSMTDMATNDKCAASTGRYLENMAGVLGISIEEMGHYYQDPVALSSTCAIFGESELIGLVAKGIPVQRLAAGANCSVIERVMPLIERMGDDVIVMSGGVALNHAVVKLLGEMSGREVLVLDNPLYNGAIGCCVRGKER